MTWTFAIRDDDTSFYTRPEELEHLYARVMELCPVSLAVVPFHLPRKPGYPYGAEQVASGPGIPLEKNAELVAWLKLHLTTKKVAIMLHGYDHGYPGIPEFAVEESRELQEKVDRGRAYLESLLATEVRVFVPPHNRLGQAGLEAVVSRRLNICPVQSMRLKRQRRWYNFLRQRYFIMRHQVLPPGLMFFRSHWEIPAYSLTPMSNLHFLRRALQQQAALGGLFVLATHFWEAQARLVTGGETVKEALYRLVDEAQKLGGQFVSLNDLCPCIS